MSLRSRLLLAFAAVVLIPVALLAFGLRQEMTRRLSEEYQLRVDRVVEVIREDLVREVFANDFDHAVHPKLVFLRKTPRHFLPKPEREQRNRNQHDRGEGEEQP